MKAKSFPTAKNAAVSVVASTATAAQPTSLLTTYTDPELWDEVVVTNLDASSYLYIRRQTRTDAAPTSSELTSAVGWNFVLSPGEDRAFMYGQNIALYGVGTLALSAQVSKGTVDDGE